ncbi:DUF429 domain-containing protein [Herbiconiux sp. P17]|uniref:DUF429 domain-containing protein n=1 Tax=Herbiconiux wuyangfengii TaxID=3342794 RepID=UPI0035B7276A
MRTAGVDLAAEPKGTALAVIEWAQDAARLVDLRLEVVDAEIVEAAGGVDKVGIDCAFGWPDAFVDFVSAHSTAVVDGASAGRAPVDGGMAWRRTLAYRENDRRAREITERWPLSVSTDRLGLTAMRCAGLLARLGEAGLDVDRAGSGRVVEVYPGASLSLWGFDTRGYRTDAEARRRLLALLASEAPWVAVGDFAELMVASGDALAGSPSTSVGCDRLEARMRAEEAR